MCFRSLRRFPKTLSPSIFSLTIDRGVLASQCQNLRRHTIQGTPDAFGPTNLSAGSEKLDDELLNATLNPFDIQVLWNYVNSRYLLSRTGSQRSVGVWHLKAVASPTMTRED